MNSHETSRDFEIPDPWHQLDALLDGEPVDRAALRSVLAEAEAREYLVDALLMRRWTRQLGPAKFIGGEAAWRRPGSPFRWVAAAMLVTTSLATGYAYGERQEEAASSIEVSLNAPPVASPPPPEPTQAIRFEPGVNWGTAAGRP
jgi:hypothetical protein